MRLHQLEEGRRVSDAKLAENNPPAPNLNWPERIQYMDLAQVDVKGEPQPLWHLLANVKDVTPGC